MTCIPKCVNELENISRTDLDRFTDKIENVLTDPRGRRLFKHYCMRSNFKDAIKCLDVYDEIDKTLSKNEKITQEILQDMVDKVDRIDEFDVSLAEKMALTDKEEDFRTVLALTKYEIARILRHKFLLFSKHYSRRNS